MKNKNYRKTYKEHSNKRKQITIASSTILIILTFSIILYFSLISEKSSSANSSVSNTNTNVLNTEDEEYTTLLNIKNDDLPKFKEGYESKHNSVYNNYDSIKTINQSLELFSKLKTIYKNTEKIQYFIINNVGHYSNKLKSLNIGNLYSNYPQAVYSILKNLTNFSFSYIILSKSLDLEHIINDKVVKLTNNNIATLRKLYISSDMIRKTIFLNYGKLKNKTLFNLLIVLNNFFWSQLKDLLTDKKFNVNQGDQEVVTANLAKLSLGLNLTFTKFSQSIINLSCYMIILELNEENLVEDAPKEIKDYLIDLKTKLTKIEKLNNIIGKLYKYYELITKFVSKLKIKEISEFFRQIREHMEGIRNDISN